MYVCSCVYHSIYMQMSEGNLQESVISIYHVGPREGTQVSRLGGKHFYMVNSCFHGSFFMCLNFLIYFYFVCVGRFASRYVCVPHTCCEGLYMLGPGSGTGVSLWMWTLRPSS